MLRRLTLVLSGTAVACAILVPTAAATHAWGNYHWARTSNPFTLTVVDTTSSKWRTHVNVAVADWTKSSVMDLVTTTGSADRRCKGITGKVKACNAAYGFNGWLGLATITVSGSHITSGTTKLNDSYFDTATYNYPYKRQHVTCQEIGHDFGLGHQDESGADLGTCMDYDRALDNEHPNAHDYQQLETIYAHVDSTSTVGTSAASPGLAGSENAQPTLVERRDRISNSVITERFADGTYRITHITWAIDGAGRP